ncbi:hypothetical protein, partial [Escherichia coli]
MVTAMGRLARVNQNG